MFEQPRREAQNFCLLRLTQLGQYLINASGESGRVRGLIDTDRRRFNTQGFRERTNQLIARIGFSALDIAEVLVTATGEL